VWFGLLVLATLDSSPPGEASSPDQCTRGRAISLCPGEQLLQTAGICRGLPIAQPGCQTEAGDRWSRSQPVLACLLLPEHPQCQVPDAQAARSPARTLPLPVAGHRACWCQARMLHGPSSPKCGMAKGQQPTEIWSHAVHCSHTWLARAVNILTPGRWAVLVS
jgi:hypothetical protein